MQNYPKFWALLCGEGYTVSLDFIRVIHTCFKTAERELNCRGRGLQQPCFISSRHRRERFWKTDIDKVFPIKQVPVRTWVVRYVHQVVTQFKEFSAALVSPPWQ